MSLFKAMLISICLSFFLFNACGSGGELSNEDYMDNICGVIGNHLLELTNIMSESEAASRGVRFPSEEGFKLLTSELEDLSLEYGAFNRDWNRIEAPSDVVVFHENYGRALAGIAGTLQGLVESHLERVDPGQLFLAVELAENMVKEFDEIEGLPERYSLAALTAPRCKG